MNASEIKWAVRLGLLALTVSSSAFSQSVEEDRIEPIADQTQRHNEVRLSVGHLSDPARRRGLYTGVTEERSYLSADVEVQRFDPVTGTLLRLYGRDLGLAEREAWFDYSRQGSWRYLLGYSETTRFEPFVVNTGLSGIGSPNVTVNGTAVRPVDYSMSRHQFSAGVDHAFDKALAIRVRFTHETKEGERIYGRGTVGASAGASGIEHLAEPVDRTTQTLEVALSYTAKDLQLSGGYYGTLFANHANGLYVAGGSAASLTAAPAFSPMSQPLDNNSHQLFVTGGYNLTPLTRAMFKASQTVAQQNENLLPAVVFAGPPASPLPGAPASLKGRVDTTIAFLDLTSFEIDRLDLQGSVRFEDRADKTPEAQYLTAAPPNSTAGPLPGTLAGQTGFNKPRSWRSLRTKAEAGYVLPAQYKVLATWELENQQRNAPEPFRRVSYRTETDESTLLVALKRPMIDNVQGSLSYGQARRTGSAYLPSTYDRDGSGGTGVPPSANPSIEPTSLVNPLIWADRDRHTWKATLEWVPLEELLINLLHERSRDFYSGRDLGPRDGGRVYTALDASYKLSDRWSAHAWWSLDDIRANQAQQVNPTNPPAGPLRGQLWQAALRQLSEGMGIGVQGRTRSGIEAGVDLAFSDQSAEQRLGALNGSPISSLPDYYYRMLELRAHGVYPLDKQSGLRADYSFQDWRTNDWTWTGWQYADGTTISEESRQRNHFVGLTYYYRWR